MHYPHIYAHGLNNHRTRVYSILNSYYFYYCSSYLMFWYISQFKYYYIWCCKSDFIIIIVWVQETLKPAWIHCNLIYKIIYCKLWTTTQEWYTVISVGVLYVQKVLSNRSNETCLQWIRFSSQVIILYYAPWTLHKVRVIVQA